MLCVLSGQITRCYANLFQDLPFFSCINLYFIIHFKIKRRIDFASPKSDASGKPRRCYYTCDHMIFMKWVISLNNSFSSLLVY